MTLKDAINIISFWTSQELGRSLELGSGTGILGGRRFRAEAYERGHLKCMSQSVLLEDAIIYTAEKIAKEGTKHGSLHRLPRNKKEPHTQ